MPKPTFENLPGAKRQAIIDLAVAEFAEHPYAVASLSRIVERAGIAKGSIYQYFEHKQDLYLFILDLAARQQLALLRAQAPPAADLDFFALLRWQMQASAQVGLQAPLLTRLMYRAVTDDVPFREEVTRCLAAVGETHSNDLLARGLERGEIDPSVSLELATLVLRGLTTELQALLLRRLGISLEAAANDLSLLDSPEAHGLYDQVVYILQYGLGKRPGRATTTGGAS